MQIESIAAIDIGSNAIRLLINNAEEYEPGRALKKNAYIRVPVRIGEDVFAKGLISPDKTEKLKGTMRAFVQLMQVFGVRCYRACATSAMREAANGPEVVKDIFDSTGLKIEIISGAEEADLIFAAGSLIDLMQPGQNYLHVDVGGGSTEVVVYSDGRKQDAISFPIGTLRILAGAVTRETKLDMESKLSAIKEKYRPNEIIASGGNINKTLKLLGGKDGDTIGLARLERFHRELAALTVEERLEQYKMNHYRADVIVPALYIFSTVGRLCNASRITIPKVGLVDGIIRTLYQGCALDPQAAAHLPAHAVPDGGGRG